MINWLGILFATAIPWIMLVGLFFILPYKMSRESGVPYKICLKSLWDYINGDRLATAKLAINALELEENK